MAAARRISVARGFRCGQPTAIGVASLTGIRQRGSKTGRFQRPRDGFPDEDSVHFPRPGQPDRRHGQGARRRLPGSGRGLRRSRRRPRREAVDDHLGRPAETLTLTENAQPALMAVSIAALRVLEARGIGLAGQAAYVAGHSLGEYSALAAAGSLSLADAARLLRTARAGDAGRGAGRRRRDGGPHRPRSRRCQRGRCRSGGRRGLCRAPTTMAPARWSSRAVAPRSSAAIEIARAKGAKRAILLPVSAPFHCALMAPAAAVMEEALAGGRPPPTRRSARRQCRWRRR